MSTPSYALSKKGNTWVASGKMPSGREFRFECGKGSREAAAAVADMKMQQKAAASNGSKARWAKFHADREASKKAAAAAPVVPASSSSSAAPVVPPSTPPAQAAADTRSAEVWARLKALGDTTSAPGAEPKEEPDDAGDEDGDDDKEEEEVLEPDEVLAPGASRGEDDDEGEDDGEAQELISDAIATAVVSGTIKVANIPLKKKGKRGEPDDRFRDLEHKGIKRIVEKMVDGHMKLSPGMQVLVGAVGTVLTVWINAEDIEGAQPRPAAAAAASSPAPAEGSTNGAGSTAPAEPTSLSLANQVGVFGAGAGVREN